MDLRPRDFKSLAYTDFAIQAAKLRLGYTSTAWASLFRRNGGQGRNRTGVRGFAGRCMTTLPPGQTFGELQPLKQQNPGEPRFCPETGAGNETRTRDPDLGKVVLYQLSYSRKRLTSIAKSLWVSTPRCNFSSQISPPLRRSGEPLTSSGGLYTDVAGRAQAFRQIHRHRVACSPRAMPHADSALPTTKSVPLQLQATPVQCRRSGAPTGDRAITAWSMQSSARWS